jgi:GAF domain-containing protein
MSHHSPEGVTERQLLQTVVGVARHVYQAAASSVFMTDPGTGELVFAAVAGAGEESLVGRRFAPGSGIAGYVAASCEVLIVDDVDASDLFARDLAASTGYLPSSVMAAPLLAEGECIGVLEVLDRHAADCGEPIRVLDDIELLCLLARQAALSLALVRRAQQQAPRAAPLASLLARLSDHAATGASDPLAAALLGVSLDLLDRACASPRLAG